ncbi:hypothetical protein K474DRAFT_1712824 [Panus rudis PR-1116 ss-1]|nr:hypothetical protein K474DRAFT_1712824 [Panus rudis PR-1116 ss-1]
MHVKSLLATLVLAFAAVNASSLTGSEFGDYADYVPTKREPGHVNDALQHVADAASSAAAKFSSVVSDHKASATSTNPSDSSKKGGCAPQLVISGAAVVGGIVTGALMIA